MTILRKRFNNFFIIVSGVAKDLGNSEPKNTKPKDNKNVFALVKEFKSNKMNSARKFLKLNQAELEQMAINIVEKDMGKEIKTVIIGKGIGKQINGIDIFRDKIGFTFIEKMP